jgi:hypothetical protein
MKKVDIDHIQRSRFLASGQKMKSNVERIVQNINLKYPEIADNIEIPHEVHGQQSSNYSQGGGRNYFFNLFNRSQGQQILC